MDLILFSAVNDCQKDSSWGRCLYKFTIGSITQDYLHTTLSQERVNRLCMSSTLRIVLANIIFLVNRLVTTQTGFVF
jgi:hypothetical protein